MGMFDGLYLYIPMFHFDYRTSCAGYLATSIIQKVNPCVFIDPESFDDIMRDFEEKVMGGVTHWQHPSFFAFFPANSSFPGILGDMVSDMINCIGYVVFF